MRKCWRKPRGEEEEPFAYRYAHVVQMSWRRKKFCTVADKMVGHGLWHMDGWGEPFLAIHIFPALCIPTRRGEIKKRIIFFLNTWKLTPTWTLYFLPHFCTLNEKIRKGKTQKTKSIHHIRLGAFLPLSYAEGLTVSRLFSPPLCSSVRYLILSLCNNTRPFSAGVILVVAYTFPPPILLYFRGSIRATGSRSLTP